jgi:hypothetical protein
MMHIAVAQTTISRSDLLPRVMQVLTTTGSEPVLRAVPCASSTGGSSRIASRIPSPAFVRKAAARFSTGR